MEGGKMLENHLTSAAAFVEGGIQDSCDDACSICLEDFGDSDPSTVTTCKHEYHLQCILEWCQRSSQCPMCWQPISLKDPTSQELLDAVENERSVRMNPPRNTTIFHHPTLGDFELQHLPVSANESELEDHIIQHLAAAAAMGRARLARREGQRIRSSTRGRPHYLVFSTNPNGDSANPVVIAGGDSPFINVGEDSAQVIGRPSSPQADHLTATETGSSHQTTSSVNRRSPTQNSPNGQDRAGPSDFQSFSESVKSRLSAFSTRYKESISKNTRSWKDRLFARNSTTPDPHAEVHRDIDRGIATLPRMVEHLEIAEGGRTNITPVSNNAEDNATQDPTIQHTFETSVASRLTEDEPRQAPCTTSSAST